MEPTKTLEKLFQKCAEWRYDNPTSPMCDNPYADRIWEKFLSYFSKHYKMYVSYRVPWSETRVEYDLDRDDLENATMHALFDCTSMDECVNLLTHWVVSYFEDTTYERLSRNSKFPYEYDIDFKVFYK